MKISDITSNARKKEFEIRVGEEKYRFPFAKLRLVPTSDNPVVEVFADPELGREAFTYQLESGEEDTIHLDAVFEVNMDPNYLRDLLLHRLSVEAKKGLEESGLGKRQVARHLGTSPAQLYRLLDPENRGKNLGQILYVLHLVDRRVELIVSPKSSPRRSVRPAFQVYCDKSGLYRFRLKKADGGVALLSTTFSSKNACLRAIRKVRNCALHDSCFERERTDGGRYLFKLMAKNHHVIARSPAFQSAARRDAALALVRKKAATVGVVEVCASVPALFGVSRSPGG